MLCMCLNFIIILFSLSGNENPMAGQKCNAVPFHPTRATQEHVLKLPPARRKQTVYHLTHCTRSTRALPNMLIILIIIMMIAGR